MFPIYSFLSPASPFPTRWLPRVGSPLFLRYYEAAKTSGCSFPRSSFPSNDGYLLDSCFLSLASGPWSCSRYAWALVYRSRHLAPVLSQKEEAVGSLKFPGNPLVLLPCSQTPVGSPRQALLRRFDSALAFRTTKAPTSIIISIREPNSCGSHGAISRPKLVGATPPSILATAAVVAVQSVLIAGSIIQRARRKRAEERFRVVVEAAPNAMLVANAEGKINLANAQVEAVFGYARQELVGHSVEMLIPEDFVLKHPAIATVTLPISRRGRWGLGGNSTDGAKTAVRFRSKSVSPHPHFGGVVCVGLDY